MVNPFDIYPPVTLEIRHFYQFYELHYSKIKKKYTKLKLIK